MGFLKDFKAFAMKGSVIDLAVGVVIGTAVNDLVKNLVDDLISPFVSLISPETQLQSFEITIRHSTFKIGAVVNSLLSFLIICLVVYLLAKVVLRNEELLKKG